MQNIKERFQQRIESLALETVFDETGKDTGDFGGIEGLINWLENNGNKEHAEILKDTFKL